jgi:tetratricopeptide (TPR) repeat protein
MIARYRIRIAVVSLLLANAWFGHTRLFAQVDALALHASAGAAAMTQQNWSKAEVEYRAALQLAPGIAELVSNLGLALYFQKNYKAAADTLEKAVRLDPKLFVPNLFLGRLRAEQNRPAEAVHYLQQCVQLQPKNVLARRLLAQALVSAGEPERALDQLREASLLEPHDTESFYSIARVTMSLASVSMEKAAADPVEGLNYQNLVLARRFEIQGAWQRARTYYLALRQSNASLPGVSIAFELGSIALAQGDAQTAVAEFERAVHAEPQSFRKPRGETLNWSPEKVQPALDWLRQSAHESLGADLALALVGTGGEKTAAVERFEHQRALLEQPLSGDLHGDALALFEAGNTEQAAERLREFVHSHPDDANAAYWLGRCYERMSHEAWQRMIELQPDSHRVRQLTAELDVEEGRTGEAIAHYREALASKPGDRQLIFGLGQAYMKDGQAPAAIDEFQQALTLDSRDAAANLNIARCYLMLNDPERSYQFARRAVAIDPTMLAAHRVIGRTLLMEGRTAEAVAELEKAAPSDRDGSVHYQIFLGYRKLRETAKAEAALRRTRELRARNRPVNLDEGTDPSAITALSIDR